MLSWLSMMINFKGQPDLLKDVQIVGKTLFLGISVRMSPEETRIWVSSVSKDGFPYQWGRANRTKGRRRTEFSFSVGAEISILSCPQTRISWSWSDSIWLTPHGSPTPILRPLIWDWIHSHRLPGSPAWRWQIMGLGLHNLVHISLYNKHQDLDVSLYFSRKTLTNLHWIRLDEQNT